MYLKFVFFICICLRKKKWKVAEINEMKNENENSISMAGYVNTVRAIVCSDLPAREASNFCDFWKLTSCNFIAFISSLIELNFFFYMCLLRINLPNLCPNMNHFDAVDFSECHSEKVISFFWRSVYIAFSGRIQDFQIEGAQKINVT